MAELELSVIWHQDPELLRTLLEGFEPACRILRMGWDEAWGELVKVTIYRAGPDVSQVAAPWVSNFAAMNALRSFAGREVATMGGADAFLQPAWQTVLMGGRRQVWAIPWLTDVRVVYYWRDMLEQAGVDEQTAFETPERLEETLGRLQANGVTPWAVPTRSEFLTLHNVVSWIWNAGGDLLSADGKRPLFDQSEARAGLCAYFSLHRYMPPGVQLTNHEAFTLITERKVAAAMGPSGWLADIRAQAAVDDVRARLGVALPPGPPYVGGSNLVVWEHSRRARDGVKLVRFLTSKELQLALCSQIGHLPVRLDALAEPPYTTDPHFRVLAEALGRGRTYPTLLRWGLVEERLSSVFIQVWDDILAEPDQDLDGVIARHLEPAAERLEMVLAESG